MTGRTKAKKRGLVNRQKTKIRAIKGQNVEVSHNLPGPFKIRYTKESRVGIES